MLRKPCKALRQTDGATINVFREDVECFRLERENEGCGIWALYPVKNGVKGEKMDRDRYSNDILEGIDCGFYRTEALTQIGDYFVVPVSFDVGDFYISGTGHLCARTPVRMVLTEEPVVKHGIISNSQIVGYASLAEQQEAGLDTTDPHMTALLLLRRRMLHSPETDFRDTRCKFKNQGKAN